MKKILCRIGIVIGVLTVTYLVVVLARFAFESSLTKYSEIVNNPRKLTIVYKDGCKRCMRTLPKVFLRHGLSLKSENVIEQGKISNKQKQKLNIQRYPSFIFDGKTISTTDMKIIDKLWNSSH